MGSDSGKKRNARKQQTAAYGKGQRPVLSRAGARHGDAFSVKRAGVDWIGTAVFLKTLRRTSGNGAGTRSGRRSDKSKCGKSENHRPNLGITALWVKTRLGFTKTQPILR